jgi:O-antigen/teichoic acid export membrane protein
MIIEKKQLKRNYDSLFFLGLIGVVVLSIVIVLSYIISGPFVIKLLFGSKFSAAGPYLGIYGIFMAFVTVANYLMTVCLAINKVQSGTIVLIGAICESLAILFFHNSLLQVMISISIVSGILMSILLIYYRYGPLNKSGSE